MTRLFPGDKLCLWLMVLVAILPGSIIYAWDAPAGGIHPAKPIPTGAVAVVAKVNWPEGAREGPTWDKPQPAQVEPLGTFKAYAYCPCSKCCGVWAQYGLTASGTSPQEGRTVAADWSVIPSGTEIYIEGLGWRTVEDTGSGIDGQTLDVFYHSHQDAINQGVRQVAVYTRKEATP